MTANGFDGIDLDYEAMNFGGTATDKASARNGFVTLVRELERGFIRVDAGPKPELR